VWHGHRACYWHLKISAGLGGHQPSRDNLTERERQFIGVDVPIPPLPAGFRVVAVDTAAGDMWLDRRQGLAYTHTQHELEQLMQG
jgi:hypothetical protein